MSTRIVTPTSQSRFIDPYQVRVFQYNTPSSDVFLSRVVNSVYKIFGDDIVIDGFLEDNINISFNDTSVTATIEPGMVIQDSTLIDIKEPATVTFDNLNSFEDGHILLYIRYRYLESVESNPAQICINYLNTGLAVNTIYDSTTESNITGVSGYPTYTWYHESDRTIFAVYRFLKDEDDHITEVTREEVQYIDVSGKRYWLYGYDFSKSRIRQYLTEILMKRPFESIVYEHGLRLENDEANPGPDKVYGTDSSGEKGWKIGSSIYTDEGSVAPHSGNQYRLHVRNGNLVLIENT